jgi:RNA polymerase sigma-70 factor, ECF subfamily
MAPTGTSPGQVTALLKKWTSGDDSALEHLIPLVYADLRKAAARALNRERPGHILQPTALVNEAYLRLARESELAWQNRSHFVAVAARVMRKILVDYAREHRRKKRGGGAQLASLETAVAPAVDNPEDVLLLDDALTRLAKEHPRKSRLIELHSFGGLTLAEAAEFLSISENTAQRDWKFARAWISRELGYDHPSQNGPRSD